MNEDCNKCRQTVANCECHIPLREKHKGLFNMVDLFKKLTSNKKGL